MKLPGPLTPRLQLGVKTWAHWFLPLSASVAIFASAFSPRDVHAYVQEGPSWPSGSTVTFQMALGNAGRTLSDGNVSWDVAAESGRSSLESKRSAHAIRYRDQSKCSGKLRRPGQCDRLLGLGFGQSFGSGTLAVTYYRYSGSTLSEADILFNTQQTFDSYSGALRFGSNGYAIADIRRVLIHELDMRSVLATLIKVASASMRS